MNEDLKIGVRRTGRHAAPKAPYQYAPKTESAWRPPYKTPGIVRFLNGMAIFFLVLATLSMIAGFVTEGGFAFYSAGIIGMSLFLAGVASIVDWACRIEYNSRK